MQLSYNFVLIRIGILRSPIDHAVIKLLHCYLQFSLPNLLNKRLIENSENTSSPPIGLSPFTCYLEIKSEKGQVLKKIFFLMEIEMGEDRFFSLK
jgi:hypothetical protein